MTSSRRLFEFPQMVVSLVREFPPKKSPKKIRISNYSNLPIISWLVVLEFNMSYLLHGSTPEPLSNSSCPTDLVIFAEEHDPEGLHRVTSVVATKLEQKPPPGRPTYSADYITRAQLRSHTSSATHVARRFPRTRATYDATEASLLNASLVSCECMAVDLNIGLSLYTSPKTNKEPLKEGRFERKNRLPAPSKGCQLNPKGW